MLMLKYSDFKPYGNLVDKNAYILQQTRLFQGLSQDELLKISASVDELLVQKGDFVVRQGEAGDALYLIVSGQLEVLTAADGQDVILAELGPRDFFGEQALMPGRTGRRNASVRAGTSARLLKVTRSAFEAALDQPLQHELELKYQQQMEQRMSKLSELIGVVNNARGLTDDALEHVKHLGHKSMEIGRVMNVIDQVASQTKLLALNAGIEAVRAGESGRGFSVVAQEVKQLAMETARSVADIHEKIEAIQSSTFEAVNYLQKIDRVIERIESISAHMADSFGEQEQVGS